MNIKYLRGAGQGRYIVINRGVSLFDNINKYNGVRLILEKTIISLSQVFYAPFVNSTLTEKIDGCLVGLVERYGDIERAFFLDTSWYKNTYFVGSVFFLKKRYFLKCFKFQGESLKEAANKDQISRLYYASFNFSEIEFVDEHLIAYDLIPNTGAQCSYEFMNIAAIKMYNEFISESNKVISFCQLSNQIRPLIDKVESSELIICQFRGVVEKLRSDSTILQLLYCHGDFTTWNTVIGIDAPHYNYVVDYECCDERVLYTDLFHLFTQKACLEGEKFDFYPLLLTLSNDLNSTIGEMLKYYLGYLLEELFLNLSEWKKGKNHQQLFNLIEIKLTLVVQSYTYMQVEQ